MPAVTRIGDADVPHCSGMVRAEGSANVFVNNIAWSCQGDVNTVHLLPPNIPPCASHAAPISTGSTTVFVNGDGAGSDVDQTAFRARVPVANPAGE